MCTFTPKANQPLPKDIMRLADTTAQRPDETAPVRILDEKPVVPRFAPPPGWLERMKPNNGW